MFNYVVFMSNNPMRPQVLNKQISKQLILKREDLLGERISGNKFRELKYNILEAQN